MKKCLSIVLCLVMVLSIFAVLPFSAFAKDVDVSETGLISESQFLTKINELKVKYPEGSSPDYNYYEGGAWRSGTCMGFADKLAYYCFGSTQWTSGGGWSKSTDKSSFNAGDCVRIDGDSHSIFITYVNGNTIKYAEGNYDYDRHIVRWDVQISLSALQSRFKYKHHLSGNNLTGTGSTPTPSSDFEPVIIGNDVLVTITNAKGVMGLAGTSGNNAIIENKSNSDAQKWRFERQSDDSYKITNVAYGKCLDVSNAATSSKTNIGIWTDNGNDAQRFFIRQATNGYALVPKINKGLAVDIVDGNLTSGNNVQDYTWNDSNAQTFAIDPYSIAPSATTTYNGHTYEYYSTGLPWTVAYRYCESKGGHLATITSSDENSVVYNLCKGKINVIWLGGTVYGTVNNIHNWYWITGESFSYAPWNSGEPNNTNNNETYLTMWIDEDNSGTWNDARNNSQGYNKVRGFVCEYENGNVSGSYSPSATVTKNGVKYEVYDGKADWQTAANICKAKGGKLARIDSASKNATVAEVAASGPSNEYWIDATDRRSEGIWAYGDGSNLSYTNWLFGEPNNDSGMEQYAALQKEDGKWIDLKSFSPAYRKTGFICEYEMSKPSKSTITTFDLQNWSDGSFKRLNIAWTATSNTDRYEILFYNYTTGDCDKVIDCGSATSVTLNYSDVPKGAYWVCIKSINQFDANWSESEYGEFVAPPTPTSGWVKASKNTAAVGDEITFTFGGEGVTPVSNYWGTIKKDGVVVVDENWNYYTGTGRTLTFDTPGTYTAYVNVNHNSGSVNSPEITFVVKALPTSVKLNKDDLTLSTGETYQLKASVYPGDTYDEVTWSSSKTAVATVDKNGKVKGVAEGTAIIYVTTANGLKAPCVVQVTGSAKGVLGDADGDGIVSIVDATAIQRKLAGLSTKTYVEAAADADGDGKVTILDATAIQRYLAGLPTNKNIGQPIK